VATTGKICSSTSTATAKDRSAAECRTVCLPDEVRDSRDCCVPATSPGTQEAPATGCPLGQSRSSDTAGRCCWVGQAWTGQCCAGTPTTCPEGYVVTQEGCGLPACEKGHTRMIDGVHCCWPGQAWSNIRHECIGNSPETLQAQQRDAEERRTAASRVVAFVAKDSSGPWALAAADGSAICTLPCNRVIPPQSGYTLRLKDVTLAVPDTFPYPQGQPLRMSPVSGGGLTESNRKGLMYAGFGGFVPAGGLLTLIGGLFVGLSGSAPCIGPQSSVNLCPPSPGLGIPLLIAGALTVSAGLAMGSVGAALPPVYPPRLDIEPQGPFPQISMTQGERQ
jgi:hypothetical protein